MKRNRSREEPRVYETTDEEMDFKDKLIRKVNCRRKDCTVVMVDHMVRKRVESGK